MITSFQGTGIMNLDLNSASARIDAMDIKEHAKDGSVIRLLLLL